MNYLFSPDNWEIMVKVLNGCGVNHHYWVFSASTTNLFYRIHVFDVVNSTGKTYFNYPGPPAPANTPSTRSARCSSPARSRARRFRWSR